MPLAAQAKQYPVCVTLIVKWPPLHYLAKATATCRDGKTAYRTCSHLMKVAALFAVILEVARKATTLFFCCQNC